MAHSSMLVAAGLLLSAGPVSAQANAICDALDSVAHQTEITGQPQRVTLYKSEPMALACTLSGDPIGDGYCRAVIDGISIEFYHIYPWTIEGCLRAGGMQPRAEVVREYTGLRGRGRMVHLTALLDGGVRLDLQYTPDVDPSGEGENQNYYGRYELVLWTP